MLAQISTKNIGNDPVCKDDERQNTYNSDVAKLVCSGDGVVVEEGGACEPARIRIIGEDDQLVLHSFVAQEVETFLDVWNNDSFSHRLDVDNEVRDVLKRENKYIGFWRSGTMWAFYSHLLTRHYGIKPGSKPSYKVDLYITSYCSNSK